MKYLIIQITLGLILIFSYDIANAWNDNEIGTMIYTYDKKCPEGMIPVLGQIIDLNKYPKFKRGFPPEKRFLKLEDSRNKKDFGRSCLIVE